jgi:hypothetical protein
MAAEEKKSFTAKVAKVAKDYKYEIKRTDGGVFRPLRFAYATLSDTSATLGLVPINIP